MATVTLKNGKTGEIPDGLSDADAAAAITRLNNAIESDNQTSSNWNWTNVTPAQLVQAADTASGGRVSGAASWLNQKSGGLLAPAANMAGSVAANVATLPWDAPAAITNAITHTAQNYGYLKGEPDIPYFSPAAKASIGVTPNTGPVSSRLENALTIASTGGEGLLTRLVRGVTGEGLAEGGSYAGQKIAEATDPRLSPLLEITGAIGANAAPYEQIFSKLLTPVRGKDAGATYDAAVDTQNAINAASADGGMTRPPITTGMVGSPVVKQFERAFGAIPILGQGIESARENAKEGMVQGRDVSAEQVGATPTDQTATAPGTALKFGTEGYLKNVSQRMDNIESNIAGNTQGPGGGAALIDVHPLLDNLQAMKTTTDAAGNVHPNVAPEIGSMIDNEISNINRARTPEDPALHTQLVNQAQALQFAISAPNTPAAQIPALQAQLAQTAAAIDANLKIPFTVLRQMKTLNSAEVNADGTRSLNGHMGGQVLDAYRDTIQNHVNALDPQLGAQYRSLNDEYSAASTANRAVANQGEGSLTSMLRRGLGSPSTVQPFAQTPVWGEAAGNTIGQIGQSTGKFVPREFAKTWDNMTPAAKALYTQTHPEAAAQLNNVSQLARNFDIPTETGGLSKSLAALEVLNKVLESVHLKGALAAMPIGYLGQSMPLIRTIAGRPQPYFQTLRENLPALLAVARNQGQTQQGQ